MDKDINKTELFERDLFVCDPVEKKDKISSHIEYTLTGKLIENKTTRRYKEFDAFRNKLNDTYLGLYIPSLPHKQMIGETNKEVVDMRIEMINRFLFKITNLNYLKNSDELNAFLNANDDDVEKVLKQINSLNYNELLNKYIEIFGEYPKNWNIDLSRINQKKFYDFLKSNLEKLSTTRKVIKSLKNQFDKNNEAYLSTVNVFTLFEKEVFSNLIEKNEDKFVFNNTKDENLFKKLIDLQENCVNPYEKLYYNFTEILLDAESLIETYEKIFKLNETYFKYKISQKEEEKKYIESIEKIIYITTFQFDNIIKDYKNKCLVDYYCEYGKLLDKFKFNNNIINNFINEILENSNIKELN